MAPTCQVDHVCPRVLRQEDLAALFPRPFYTDVFLTRAGFPTARHPRCVTGQAAGVSRGPQTHLDFLSGPRSEPESGFRSSGTGHTWTGERSSQQQQRKLHVTGSDWSAADGLGLFWTFRVPAQSVDSSVHRVRVRNPGKKSVSQQEKSDFRLIIVNL